MHIYLHQAFGWDPPQYAHACLLTKGDRSPLHKRQLDSSLASYQEQGVVPEALLNFLALLGWKHGSQTDMLNLVQLIEQVMMESTLL